ncbi:MAG: SUMF1/EgtB/PvdO family nonheme iron enzyme [Bacteroidales bacterium]|nr:SUMF1/EgtB/PvdO family nonheme iron enzyme [Bacteroidales bacterium]
MRLKIVGFNLVFLLISIIHFSNTTAAQNFIKIPQQSFNLLGFSYYDFEFFATVPEIEMSNFITLGEYKEFLDDVKQDSIELLYIKYLPDSIISFCDKTYSDYLQDVKYEQYPVVGVSWESALAFCRWKTLNDNKSEDKQSYYRLPLTSEWLSAYQYLDKNHIVNDLNKTYSDLLYCTVDETIISPKIYEDVFHFDRVYYHKSDDSGHLRRKRIIGSNFRFTQHTFLNSGNYLMSDEGAVYTAFRIVKVPVKRNEKYMKYFDL